MAIYASVETVGISCPSGTSITLMQIRRGLDAGGEVRLIQWGVAFDGADITSNTTPAKVKLERQTTGGTMTQIIGGGFKYNSGNSGSIVSWRREATAEPTASFPIEMHNVPVTGGPLLVQYPLGREPILRPVNERIGIVVQCQAGSAASAICHMVWEE